MLSGKRSRPVSAALLVGVGAAGLLAGCNWNSDGPREADVTKLLQDDPQIDQRFAGGPLDKLKIEANSQDFPLKDLPGGEGLKGNVEVSVGLVGRWTDGRLAAYGTARVVDADPNIRVSVSSLAMTGNGTETFAVDKWGYGNLQASAKTASVHVNDLDEHFKSDVTIVVSKAEGSPLAEFDDRVLGRLFLSGRGEIARDMQVAEPPEHTLQALEDRVSGMSEHTL
jgi:hypothetical protein